MEEVIKYFERLEERISTLEAELASLEAELDEVKNRPAPEPQVIEKVVEKIVEKPVEVIKEVVVEKPVPVAQEVISEPSEASETSEASEISETSEVSETSESSEVSETSEPVAPVEKEEPASPKAALYGKTVDDIRLAISLGDRFLYQRELFGQNGELMQRTLTELNALDSFEAALKYISRFNWDTESNTYQQFLVTLHRRFG